MRFRGKSIRRKIVVLLLVPLVSLTTIWGFASYLTGQEAGHLLSVSGTVDKVGTPAENTAQAIQNERRQILVYLADPRRSDALTRLRKLQRDTDQEVFTLRSNARDSGLRSDLTADSRRRLDEMTDALEGLDKIRSQVEDNTITRGGAFQAYNALVDPCYSFLTTLNGLKNVELETQGRALVGLTRAREYLSREDALMAAAIASGQMTKGDRRAFSDRVAERNLTYEINLQSLPAEEREIFEKFWNSTDGRTLRAYEDTIVGAGAGGASVVSGERWEKATSTVLTTLERLGYEAGGRYQRRVEPEATKVLTQAGLIGVLGFAAVVGSIVISFRVGRELVRDLNAVRKEANESAGVRLPSVMRRLAAGDEVDVETEAPRLEYPPDEMGQVGQALNTLQRAAVEAAVKQADMRRGVSEVFVNLARRNQVLLHRQLTLLDTMERRTEDADELADLFRLDHLTTRMRRHAEGLVILSGAAPSRQWRKPVQLMDVVRAAVSEVEDYERIEVRRLPRLAVDGSAVADLTHLIAELLENATVFSPPHTAVQVRGERVANGFTVEIHDRGLGMPADALLDANLRLAETPEFELSDTDRLGLFVVSRLAQRQGVRVSLQPSPYGGTTAVVLIPGSVLTETQDGADGGRAGLDAGEETGTPAGAETPGRSGLGALSRDPKPSLERGGSPRPLKGPVELESPLPELDAPAGGGLFGKAAAEQHQQADEETERSRPAGPRPSPPSTEPPVTAAGNGRGEARGEPDESSGRPAPLPRRRRNTPVLVSDNGRRVGGDRRGEREDDAARDRTRRAGTEAPSDPSPEPRRTRATDTGPAAAQGEGAGEEQPAATVGGLPRRVRQANLAPQLRKDGQESGGGKGERAAEPAPALEDRDADEVRSRMASLQRGWQRGRAKNSETGESSAGTGGAAGPEGDAARDTRGNGPGRQRGETAPGTTPEGDGR
ncbi:nitrate- and nitrite sensing domain-containing protein [Streptomyces sp. HNM0574]|uniref:nitrate- and nitrite sensing domain-containing protein n=1 Tax=Streptomyces sp. HNM0574 TaxID=2714954 RepID=UPI001469C09B|nr:nitrate- and nitrite sensing domain-containing protein [Streptomyces sp. HNM0574]NLU70425.1 histidine kinase [Streptomyces sp. HNM0574]